ncbi:acyl-CoA thioester hydrolase [Leucobacter exalbidus]|uniref:Acyl-CoA thioester hydrolase n=1 Tax=Leucobacter exalbidus TaxID=662960 RepID=A0A940PYY0_9MICO|nr:thioesterase family protein [Leucobacter exalbidus]MBP1326696.1 acyl-CoA thioester hydrolase [Leucobacter exalbidus]
MTHFLHRVRYHEVDKQGYLFNGRYFEIADVAMTEYFRDLGWNYDELNRLGADPSVVHIEADFASPAQFDDELDVTTECTRVGTSSFSLRTEIRNQLNLVATLQIVYVNVEAQLGESLPLPELVAAKMRSSVTLQEVGSNG